jgi:pimeloyl-ACP methyl ester carboxylesterase
MARTFAVLFLIAISLYAAVLAWLWFRQESLLFFPEPLPADYPLVREADVHELGVEVPDAKLSVLQLRLADPKGVVFFLHGNAGNLASWFTNTQLYRRANFDLVMMDYRGYGKSTGRVTGERQLRDDVRAVWQAIAPRYAGKKKVLHGRSLGTALAADLAAELSGAGAPPDLTVLVSPYSSMRELTDEFYPWVPSLVLRYPLDTSLHAKDIASPILVLHGERDELIGLQHAHRLRRKTPRVHLEEIPRAGHNDIHMFPAYEKAVLDALARL